MKRHDSKGFTLIELMVVVTIIGLIASVALPGYTGMVTRSKKAERNAILRNITDAVRDYITQHERLPDRTATGSELECKQNPPGDITGAKKSFDPSMPGWKELGWEPTGQIYHHYDIEANLSAGVGIITVRAVGDVDGDGEDSEFTRILTLDSSGTWTPSETDLGDDG